MGLIGVSMGGAAALLGTRPFGRLNRFMAPLVIQGVSSETGVSEDALRPIDRVGLVEAPLLMIAGTRDRYTPLAESRDLFSHAREPKELWELDGAGHENLHAFVGNVYEHRVAAFFARYLRGSATAPSLYRDSADDTLLVSQDEGLTPE